MRHCDWEDNDEHLLHSLVVL